MSKKKMSRQDAFLNYLRKEQVSVTVFLANGVKLMGVVYSFDNFSILLRRDAQMQLIYKHVISTVVPQSAIDIQAICAEMEREEADEYLSERATA
jgi:host factor-I protein